ncbi:MAG: uncharacterized membrane protein YkvA (DUF1232 family) [Maribacter sp.]|jgi:uncharacterized membrane protein YkvA (DUF1232 family)
MGKKALAFIAASAAIVYILNPTFGVYELLPDNMPIVGNLDEATATAILIWGAKTLFGKKEVEELSEISKKNKN